MKFILILLEINIDKSNGCDRIRDKKKRYSILTKCGVMISGIRAEYDIAGIMELK